MSRGAGLISRAWEKLRSLVLKETLVGADANGNKYYRWIEKDLQGEPIEKRRVRVPGNDFLYDPKIIPAEWRSWLAKTRSDPPAAEEMARSAERAAIMRQRVAAVEEREHQRRIRMETLGKQATTAGGPDINAFRSQLEHRGFAAAGKHGAAAAQPAAGPAGSSGSTGQPDAAGSGAGPGSGQQGGHT